MTNRPLLAENRTLDAWRRYFEASQLVITRLDEALRTETGSDLGEFNMLVSLAEAPERTLTLSALARRVVFSIPRMSYRVNQLLERGWVTKRACPNDGRASEVTLTDAGLERLRHIGSVHREHIAQIFDASLDLTEAETLAELTERMRARLTP